ncbi:hypothetical protein B0H16DRAFT_1820947 [Mycena metata]|uniref:Novel STAND NTPase 1 domain-containing protein n=1 Tax=Mycena metata TaxID=1033252 RepID=A0AAD7H2Q7_9AGAR|nr:hypothetical protein B0H16DRAFT_1820947 [Mycena metata]
MPRQPTATQARLNNISKCVAITANTFDVLVDTLKISGLEAISNTVQSLLKLVQTIKQDKNECAELMEQTHQLLNAIITVYIKSDTGAELPPSTLNQIVQFTETLHKIHTFVEAQQGGRKIQKLFRRGELAALLKDCMVRLQQALDFFNIKVVDTMTNIGEIQERAELRHQEIVGLIEDLALSDSASSVYSYASSNSISMLPAEPKIFHGRNSELADILKLFRQGTPRIAILGAGGMGKTSLARAVVHHEEVTTKYHGNRFFVPCDTASTKPQLAGLIGVHLGMKPGKDLTQAVLRHFSSSPPSLLILDNLETVWEPTKSRKDIEEFLSLLTDINSLALMITMRGAERPSKVQWTRPFLQPLPPLAQDAARKIFIDITDDKHPLDEVDEILCLTDNMPLSISLLAHLVDIEGCKEILSRWETERTSLISDGYTRRSNLELSISISLSSPRIASTPQAQDLLSLLSMLPDGLSDVELKQTKFPITEILGCKAALLRTALAYTDGHKRLKVLVPIREYMGKLFPPTDQMIQPMLNHFHELLESYRATIGTRLGTGPIDRITSNYTNIQNMLQKGLRREYPNIVDVAYCACDFNNFSRNNSRGATFLLEDFSNVLSSSGDHRLKVYIITELMGSSYLQPISHPEQLIVEALGHFKYFDDPDLEARFHSSLGEYYTQHNNTSAALQHSQISLSLAQTNRNIKRQCAALDILGYIELGAGDNAAGRAHAQEVQRLAKISGDLRREARGLYIESLSSISQGDYKECIALTIRGRTALSLCGLSHGQMSYGFTGIQAEVHKLKSEYAEAHDILNQILQETANDSHSQKYSLMGIAEVEVSMGVSTHEIQSKINASQAMAKATKDASATIAGDATQADLNLREGDMSTTLFGKCLQLGWGTHSEAVGYCLERLADINLWEGSHSTSWPTVFLANSLKTKERLGIYKALQFLGDLFLREEDEVTATSLFTLALEGFTKMDVHRSRAECMIRLGDISNKHGDSLEALGLWEQTRLLFEKSSQAKRVQDIDERLAGIGKDLKEQHKRNLDRLAELKAPVGMVEELDEDLSEDKLEGEQAHIYVRLLTVKILCKFTSVNMKTVNMYEDYWEVGCGGRSSTPGARVGPFLEFLFLAQFNNALAVLKVGRRREKFGRALKIDGPAAVCNYVWNILQLTRELALARYPKFQVIPPVQTLTRYLAQLLVSTFTPLTQFASDSVTTPFEIFTTPTKLCAEILFD